MRRATASTRCEPARATIGAVPTAPISLATAADLEALRLTVTTLAAKVDALLATSETPPPAPAPEPVPQPEPAPQPAPDGPFGGQLIGRSGLPWNAGVFSGNGDPTRAAEFGRWRGRDVDAVLWFQTRSGGWGTMTQLPTNLRDFPGWRILSMVGQPRDQNNAATANGQNDGMWRTIAVKLKDLGFDDGRTIIRLNWEANLTGNSYAWDKPDAATFVAAEKRIIDVVRAVCGARVKFSANVSKSNLAGAYADWPDRIWKPLLGYVDIFSQDWYDHGPPQTSEASWQTAYSQNPGAARSLAFCKQHSVAFWLDEWGVSRGNPAGGWAGGGDNPWFVERMFRWFQENAVGNGGVLLGETTYNDAGAPGTLNHVLFPAGSNPRASERYLQLWGRR